jgi:hypothetical protein
MSRSSRQPLVEGKPVARVERGAGDYFLAVARINRGVWVAIAWNEKYRSDLLETGTGGKDIMDILKTNISANSISGGSYEDHVLPDC